MWTVIYVASNAQQAERIRNKLEEEGFLVKIRTSQTAGDQYEILVPEGEISEVQTVLSSLFHL